MALTTSTEAATARLISEGWPTLIVEIKCDGSTLEIMPQSLYGERERLIIFVDATGNVLLDAGGDTLLALGRQTPTVSQDTVILGGGQDD